MLWRKYIEENMMSDEVKTTKVGVYGTLKAGHHRNMMLGTSRQLGSAFAPGFLLHCDFFPALVESTPGMEFMKNNRIPCEIYEVSEAVLKTLDEVEGHPDHFERRWIESAPFGGYWVYYGKAYTLDTKRKVIFDGRWAGQATVYNVVDFSQGDKPHILQGRKQLLPTANGYQEVDYAGITPGTLTWPERQYTWNHSLNCYEDKEGKRYRKKPYSSEYELIVETPLPLPSTLVVPSTVVPLSALNPKVELL